MYMGADVTHPAPGSSEPSICSVVASTDYNVTKYNTYLRAQTHRVEIIEEMRSVAYLALQDYAKANDGKFPARIIFYRDGVSRGQFDEVRNVEIRALKSAMDSIKCTATVTYVIVLKRHHIRLFPTNRTDTDRSENCLPGTVIDRAITHPTDFNFILQSHAGLQGMSRPTIYNIIHDENKFSYDEIQQISYNLCFLSERATRTIAMPSPVYRAHLAAFYARIFLDGGDDASDAGSSRSGGSTVTLKKFAHGMENTHYYL
jgi:eukaryotic translation initiation factor 2C